MSAQVQIREAGLGDARAIGELWRESAAAHVALSPRMYRVPDVAEATARAERHLGDVNRATLVAVTDNLVVGVVDFAALPSPTAGSMIRPIRAVEMGIVVSATQRGQGIGRALMEAAEDRAARDGVELLTLSALAANVPAVRMYRSMGYEGSGVFMHRWLDET